MKPAKLEWEVKHLDSALYKGRGRTPEEALRDLRESVARGVADATENVGREQERLDRLDALLSDVTELPPASEQAAGN